MTKNSILLLLCVTAIGNLVGCGGGSSASGTPPPSSSITIAFQPAPPASITIVGSATFAADVTNDPLNLGVDWRLDCSVPPVSNQTFCGSINPAGTSSPSIAIHTASGAMVTYTPPSTLTTNSQPVYITAFSAADSTINVLATITVTGFASSLSGTYVFQLSGSATDPNTSEPFPYGLAGVLVADGNGNIITGSGSSVGGEQTCANSLGAFTNQIISNGSSYTISPDGTGTITLNTGEPKVGNLGIETFSIVVLSSSQALMAEIDQGNPGGSSVGTLDLQTSTALPSGSYAFVVDGMTVAIDPNSSQQDPLAFGGVFNIDSPGVISGVGSLADEEQGVTSSDGSTNGVIVSNATLSGTVVPDTTTPGKVAINLTAGFTTIPIQFTGYIVDSTHIKLVESDNSSGAGFGTTGGVAIGQSPPSGGFTNSSFNGTYVYGVLGQIASTPVLGFSSLAGLFNANGAGQLTNGYTDDANLFGVLISDTLTGTYSVDTSGIGRVSAATNFGSNGQGPTLVLYLTGGGNTPLVLDTDVLTLGAGIAYPQSSAPPSFNGLYGFDWGRFSFTVGNQVDATATFAVNGTAGTLSGTEEASVIGGQVFSGSFSSSPNGRFPGTFTEGIGSSATNSAVAIYVIDSTQGLVTETDGNAFGVGHFATQTPVCPSCEPAVGGVKHQPAVRTGPTTRPLRPGGSK